MNPCINYKDTVTFIATKVDNYGDDIEIEDTEQVACLVEMGTGWQHNANQDAGTSDAIVYVDPTNDFIADNYYRLEEMYIIIELFGTPQQRGWYKVVQVDVNRDLLLCNDIDTVVLSLKKTASLYDVS